MTFKTFKCDRRDFLLKEVQDGHIAPTLNQKGLLQH